MLNFNITRKNISILLWKNHIKIRRNKIELAILLFQIAIWIAWGSIKYAFVHDLWLPAIIPPITNNVIPYYDPSYFKKKNTIGLAIENIDSLLNTEVKNKNEIDNEYMNSNKDNNNELIRSFVNIITNKIKRNKNSLKISLYNQILQCQEEYWVNNNIISCIEIVKISHNLDNIQIKVYSPVNELPSRYTTYQPFEICRPVSHIYTKIANNQYDFEEKICEAGKLFSGPSIFIQSLLSDSLIELSKVKNNISDNVNRDKINQNEYTIAIDDINIYLRSTPQKTMLYSEYSKLAYIAPISMMFAFSRVIYNTMYAIAADKINKNYWIERLHGISDAEYNFAYLINNMIMSFLYTGTAIFVCRLCNIFKDSNYALVYFIFYAYLLSLQNFGHFIGSFFYTTTGIGYVSVLVNLLLNTISMITLKYSNLNNTVFIICCLVSPFAFIYFLSNLLKFITIYPLTFKYLFKEYNFKLRISLLILVFDIFMYYIFAVLIQRILNNGIVKYTNAIEKFTLEWCNRILFRKYKISVDNARCLPTTNYLLNEIKKVIEPTPSYMLKKEKIVCLRNLYYNYGYTNNNLVINGLNLDIYEGEVFAILGHNGSGKSTLFSLLCGILQHNYGSITVLNLPCIGHTKFKPNQISLCPQYNFLYDELLVIENLIYFAGIKGIDIRKPLLEIQSIEIYKEQLFDKYSSFYVPSIKSVSNLVTTWFGILDLVCLLDLTKNLFTFNYSLSGGQKKRLAFIISIIGLPKLILLDEPTTGVDPVGRRMIWKIINLHNKLGTTFVISTHDVEEAEIVAVRKAIIINGTIGILGTNKFLRNELSINYFVEIYFKHDIDIIALQKVGHEIRKLASELFWSINYDLLDNFSECYSGGNYKISLTMPKGDCANCYSFFKIIENKYISEYIENIILDYQTLKPVFLMLKKANYLANNNGVDNCEGKYFNFNKYSYYCVSRLAKLLIINISSALMQISAYYDKAIHYIGCNNILINMNKHIKKNVSESHNLLVNDAMSLILPTATKDEEKNKKPSLQLQYKKTNDGFTTNKYLMHSVYNEYESLLKYYENSNFAKLYSILYLRFCLLYNNKLRSLQEFIVPIIILFCSSLINREYTNEYINFDSNENNIVHLNNIMHYQPYMIPYITANYNDKINIQQLDIKALLEIIYIAKSSNNHTQNFAVDSLSWFCNYSLNNYLRSDRNHTGISYKKYLREIHDIMRNSKSSNASELKSTNLYSGITPASQIIEFLYNESNPLLLMYENLQYPFVIALDYNNEYQLGTNFYWSPYKAYSLPVFLHLITKQKIENNNNNEIPVIFTYDILPIKRRTEVNLQNFMWFVYSMLNLTFFTLPQKFGYVLMNEKNNKCKHILYITGISHKQYWIGTILMYTTISNFINLFILYIIFKAMKLYSDSLYSITAIIVGISLSTLASNAFAYFWTFIFTQTVFYSFFMQLVNIVFTILPAYISSTTNTVNQTSDHATYTPIDIITVILAFTCAPYLPMAVFISVGKVILNYRLVNKSNIISGAFLKDPTYILVLIGCIFQFLVYLCGILYIEQKQYQNRNPSKLVEATYKKHMNTKKHILSAIKQLRKGFLPEDKNIVNVIDEDIVRERNKVLFFCNLVNSKEHQCTEIPYILMNNVSYCYPNFKIKSKFNVALSNIFLTVAKSEIFGLLGPNGAGKTTLFNVLLNDIQNDRSVEGSVYLNGLDLIENYHNICDYIGVVYQFNFLWPELTLYNLLKLFTNIKSKRNVEEEKKNYRLVQLMGMENDLHIQLKMLSEGKRRRCNIILAFVGNNKIILLDEPSSSIDPEGRYRLKALLDYEKHDKAILISTHDMLEAEALSDRLGIIVNGQLKCANSPLVIRNKYGSSLCIRIELDPNPCTDYGSNDKYAFKILQWFQKNISMNLKLLVLNSNILEYTIPEVDVVYSNIFNSLATIQTEIKIHDYTISQQSLHYIFWNFAKHQVNQQDNYYSGDF